MDQVYTRKDFGGGGAEGRGTWFRDGGRTLEFDGSEFAWSIKAQVDQLCSDVIGSTSFNGIPVFARDNKSPETLRHSFSPKAELNCVEIRGRRRLNDGISTIHYTYTDLSLVERFQRLL